MKYESERIYLRAWTAEDAVLLQHFQLRNREQIERKFGGTDGTDSGLA
nr:hypothetical protein [Paenibacillus xylanexedens]